MFERYTERARQVIVLAQDEARAFKHNYIGTEHILLGLIREEEGLAARVLHICEVPLDNVRSEVARIVGHGDAITTGQIPFTPRARKVQELALREALSLGHNFIGTEHLLLGLVRENEGVAARILLDFDAEPEKIRNEIIRMLSGPARQKPKPFDGYGLSDAVKRAIGELVNRGWTVKPTGWWHHPASRRPTTASTFEVSSPDGHIVHCGPSDLLLTGEFPPYVEDQGEDAA